MKDADDEEDTEHAPDQDGLEGKLLQDIAVLDQDEHNDSNEGQHAHPHTLDAYGYPDVVDYGWCKARFNGKKG